MANKKIKMEEDDENSDQEPKPTNSALNPVVISEAGSGSRTDEDTGVEQQQLVVASNQSLSYQLAPGFDPIFNRAPSMYQLQPHFGSLNQPASSSTPSFNPGQLLQQPHRSSLNQPESSPIPAVNRAPFCQFQSPRGSFNEPGSSSIPASVQNYFRSSTQGPDTQLMLMTSQQLNPVVNNEVGSRSRTDQDTGVEQQQLVVASTSNQALSYQLALRFGPAFNRAPFNQSQPYFGSLNQLGSSSNPCFNPGLLPQQPLHGSLNQRRSSLIPAVNLAPLHQLQSSCGSFNELGSSNPQQPPLGSLNQPRSSIPAVNLSPSHQFQSRRGSFNELGSSSNPQQPPLGSLNHPRSSSIPAVNQPSLLQLLHARIIEVTSKKITVPLKQVGRIMGIQGETVNYITEVSGASIRQIQNEKLRLTIPFEIRGTRLQIQAAESLVENAMDRLLHIPGRGTYSLFRPDTPDPSRVLKCIGIRASRMNVTLTCGSSLCSKRGELIQYIRSRFISPPIVMVNFPEGCNFAIVEVVGTNHVIAEVNHLIDIVVDILSTRSGPGSTSRNVIAAPAGGESEGPANTAAGDILSATDADEKQGEEENADTSQDGNTRGSSSA